MIFPVYDTVVLPNVEYQLGIEDLSDAEKSRLESDGSYALLVPTKDYCRRKQLTMEKVSGFGVLLRVLDIKMTNLGTRLHAISEQKVRITDASCTDDIPEGSFLPLDEINDLTKTGYETLVEDLRNTSLMIADNFQNNDLIKTIIRKCHTINELAALVGPFIDMTPAEKYSLLVTDSMKTRGLALKGALLRFRGTVEMQIDLQEKYNDGDGQQYKKAAILKQIDILQKQLSEMDPDSISEEEAYRKKIADSGMSEEARLEAERILKRLQTSQPHDPERNSMENYLNFLTELKWRPDKLPVIQLEKARRILDRDHYGMEKVKDRIIEQLAVMQLKNSPEGSILLLTGAPGTGKTSIARGVAEALGRKYVRISLGGIRDEAEIRGHRRTYIGAMPGRIMEGIKRSGAMNPVIVLDEVDKLTQGGINGDPSSALLEVLDPEQNSTFVDHYLNVSYDLSGVFFICTANTIETIPRPLLDRMEVIRLAGYTPADKLQIARKHLLKRSLRDNGLTSKDLRISAGALRKLISDYTAEAGVRGLKKQLDTICRKEAAAFIQNGREPIALKEKDIEPLLGKPLLRHDRIAAENPSGIVTGLAWTQAGGEILFIEAVSMKGSGRMQLTGQLGDVMKESASIAFSLAKSTFADSDINFSGIDIHIHVPAGAVPKDGPSAGITIFTALYSLLSDRKVPSDLAMTGEISLRGRVLPIGGLPEKLMAAERAGIRRVLIPQENVRDLEEIPQEVLQSLRIIPVKTAEDVIREAFA